MSHLCGGRDPDTGAGYDLCPDCERASQAAYERVEREYREAVNCIVSALERATEEWPEARTPTERAYWAAMQQALDGARRKAMSSLDHDRHETGAYYQRLYAAALASAQERAADEAVRESQASDTEEEEDE